MMKNNPKILVLPFLMMGLLVMLTNGCTKDDDPITTLEDIDGNVYKTVTIGTQVWMDENLKTTHFNDGSAIPLVTQAAEWGTLSTPGYCWYGNDAAAYGDTYGALYNWHTVNTDMLCPSGWHVPTDADWEELTTYLGGDSIAGGKLKETLTTHWQTPNTGATNETGFAALPNGYRNTNGEYSEIEISGYFWSSTEISGVSAWSRNMSFAYKSVSRDGGFMNYGFAVRCLKN